MPNYTFKCKACTHEWTEFLPMDERGFARCPKCHAQSPERVWQPPAVKPFQFGVFEHITDEPVRVRNKQEMLEVRRRYNVDVPGVLD